MNVERARVFNGKNILLAGYSQNMRQLPAPFAPDLRVLVGEKRQASFEDRKGIEIYHADRKIVSAGNRNAATDLLTQRKFDLLITKTGLSEFFEDRIVKGIGYDPIGGFGLVSELRKSDGWETPPNTGIIMIRGSYSSEEAIKAYGKELVESLDILPYRLTLPLFLAAIEKYFKGDTTKTEIPPELQDERNVPREYQNAQVIFLA